MLLKAIVSSMVLTLIALAGSPASDDEKNNKKAEVFVVKATSGDDHAMKVIINGEHLSQEDLDLEVGESKTIELDSGNEAVITRNENGYKWTVDGEDIFVNDIESHSTVRVMVTGDGDEDHDVRVYNHNSNQFSFAHGNGHAMFNQGVTILGLEDLDESVIEQIKQVLRDAGVEKEIHVSKGPKMIWVDDEGTTHHPNGSNMIFIQSDDGDEEQD